VSSNGQLSHHGSSQIHSPADTVPLREEFEPGVDLRVPLHELRTFEELIIVSEERRLFVPDDLRDTDALDRLSAGAGPIDTFHIAPGARGLIRDAVASCRPSVVKIRNCYFTAKSIVVTYSFVNFESAASLHPATRLSTSRQFRAAQRREVDLGSIRNGTSSTRYSRSMFR
jgi:hypothetical protein